MTAKTKHGFHGGHSAGGADPGTPHEQLMRDHRRPGRAEGASIHGHGHAEDKSQHHKQAMHHQRSGREEHAGYAGQADGDGHAGLGGMGPSAPPMGMGAPQGQPGAPSPGEMAAGSTDDSEEGEQT